MRLDQLLELLGGHVLAPSSDGVAQPALEVKVPALVQAAAVARVVPEPSPGPERRLRVPDSGSRSFSGCTSRRQTSSYAAPDRWVEATP